MKSVVKKKAPWYAAGLHFECLCCGRCCSGPGAGYIWVTRPEIEFIADFLKIPLGQIRREYLRRVGLRTTIIEQPLTRNCWFLQLTDGQRKCAIYPVRPNQCRTWPFWSSNLTSQKAWNEAAQKCPGINRGRLYTLEQIRKLKSQKKWWHDPKQTLSSCER